MEGNSAYNCTFTGNSAKSYGAASKAILMHCAFLNNNATNFGGAIGGSGCSADNCTFVNNYAANEGGAVYMAYVSNSEFRDNHANYGGAISGNVNSVVGSLFINNYANEMGGALSNVYAVDCEFRRNHAHEGGAMYGSSAKNCTFISNYATDTSGAIKGYSEDCIFIDNSAYRAGATEGDSRNSRFEENHAVMGGAMYASSAESCTFIKNYADEGGAIYGGSAALCDFVENHAKTGGAMYSGSAVGSNFTSNVADITGGAHYKTSAVNCVMKYNLPKYILEVSNFEAIYGFGGEIKVKLTDSSTYVNNVKTLVKIYDMNNNVVFVSNCLSGGTCFVDLDLGEFTLVVSVEDENYNVDPVTRYINIKKATSFYVVSVTATYGINNPLIINLHDAEGTPLRNAPVTVIIDGVSKTYMTNNNGQILLATDNLAPKTYSVIMNYNGDGKYFRSSASSSITVKKAKPYIVVSNMKYFAKEKPKKFYMILKDNRYRVMKNTKVTLKVNGKTYTAKTNSKGRATFKITKLNKKGKYKATVKYAGNKYYTALSKTAKITVKK
jgi:predicted outer membrane repeat protein